MNQLNLKHTYALKVQLNTIQNFEWKLLKVGNLL